MMPSRRRMGLLVVLVSSLALTAEANRIHKSLPRDGTVFIDRIDGFGPELAKAFLKEKVPWVIVSSRQNADFEITGSIRDIGRTEPEGAINVSNRNVGEVEEGPMPPSRLVAISVVNVSKKSIVWGYGVTGAGNLTNAAESCAKTLRDQIREAHKR